MKQFRISIKGNDTFRYSEQVLAENFEHACEKARSLLGHLEKLTIEALRIATIEEV